MRDIESDVIEWLEWHMGISGGMGLPSSYDCAKPRGGGGKKHIPTPKDFPDELTVCDMAMRTLDCKLMYTLQAKYLLIDAIDTQRAERLGISRSQYHRRVKKAFDWLEIAFDIADAINKQKNRAMT